MFEGMLAKKYIFSQKRQSALTVCSIAMALALITMLFSLFSTVTGNLRNIAYDQGKFHIRVTVNDGFTKEEYDAFAEAVSKYADCTPKDYTWGEFSSRYWANVTFKKYIDDYADSFAKKMCEKIGFDPNLDEVIILTNDQLMMYDMADLKSALKMAGIIAVFYVFVLFLVMMLRLIIDTAFEISSKERERQLGVLQSIGATPRQIVRIITYEGLMLSAVGIPLGVGAGLGLGYLAYRAVLSTHVAELYLSPLKAAELIHFTVNPWLLLLGIATGAVWVFLSAYGTGMRVIKMSPVQAISQRSNTVKKTGRFSIFGKLFGWTGKIASRNNLRRPKRFIASVVALTMSIALFSAVTVVVNDLQSAAEDRFYIRDNYGDFEIVSNNADDPLTVCKQWDMLEESGLFTEFSCSYTISGRDIDGNYGYMSFHNRSYDSYVSYYSQDAYQERFRGNPPPVSYDELTESGKYILEGRASGNGDDPNTILIELGYDTYISVEEYNELSADEKEFASEDRQDGETLGYDYYIRCTEEFDILTTTGDVYNRGYSIIGTIDQYKNGAYKQVKNYDSSGRIKCYLINDDDYLKAITFLDSNLDEKSYYYDNTAEIRQTRSMLDSVKIGAAFFSILIALIAVVNMVNILTTGILNRRGELAAMQCAGMTERQLYKMTAIECLQYALTSGIAAVAVCELMMFLTDKVLMTGIEAFKYLEYYINYIQPLPIIGIASLCAFVIAVVASIFPLRAMRKTSLVEQIRTVE